MNNLDNDIAAHADLPGLAVAVTRDGEIIYERGFGWADRERGLCATPNTPFTIASVSKSITATATMQLFERGSLNLDTPVNDYVGYARVRSPHWNPAESTVRRVMSHTLVDSPLSPAGAALIIPPAISMGSSTTTASRSGVLGSILGDVIARVLGNDYDPSLKKNIFAQLTCIVVVRWTSQEIRAIEKIWRPALTLWVFAGNRESIFLL